MRGTLPACCARAASGHPTTPLPRSAMNSRRLMGLTPRLGSQTNYSTVHRGKKRSLKAESGQSRRLAFGHESASPQISDMSGHLSHLSHRDEGALSHLNRGIDGVFEVLRVVSRALVSIAEVHAIVARAHLAQSEPETTCNGFGFLERHRLPSSPLAALLSHVTAASDNEAER